MLRRRPLSHFSNLAEVLSARTSESPDFPILYFLQGRDQAGVITYQELLKEAQSIGAHLLDRKVQGPAVLLYATNSVSFVKAFVGCIMAGIAAIPLSFPKRQTEVERLGAILRHSAATSLLIAGESSDRVQKFMTLVEKPDLLVLESDGIPCGTNDVSSFPQPKGHTISHLQYTSGSTADPKGVVVTHANLLSNIAYIDRGFNHAADSVAVTWLPHFHDMGLVYGLLSPLLLGFRAFILDPADFIREPFLWLETISKHHATHSGGPNFAYQLCADRVAAARVAELDLRSWRTAFLGAEMIRAATLAHFAKVFAPAGFNRRAYYLAYGLAEATLKVTGRTCEDSEPVVSFSREKLGQGIVERQAPETGKGIELASCGAALEETEVVIVDLATLKRSHDNAVGEVWVRGPGIAPGYWNKPSETDFTFHASLFADQRTYLRTGDLGFLEDGELFIVGRQKDLIIAGGANFFPEDIENSMVASDPSLRGHMAAAFSLFAPEQQERLILLQEVPRSLQAQDYLPVLGRIQMRVAEDFGLSVDQVMLLRRGSLPRTSSGKIRRSQCKQLFAEGGFQSLLPAEEALPAFSAESLLDGGKSVISQLTCQLQQVAGSILGRQPEEICLQDDLLGALFDSLELARFHAAICARFGFSVNLGELVSADNINALAVSIFTKKQYASSEGVKPASSPAPGPSRDQRTVTITDGERRLWALDQIYPNCPAHRIVFCISMTGTLHLDLLERSVKKTFLQNTSLRASFALGLDGLVKRYVEVVDVDIKRRDCMQSPYTCDQQILNTAHQLCESPLFLEHGKTAAMELLCFGAAKHCFVICFHHIVFDALSSDLFMQELARNYIRAAAQINGRDLDGQDDANSEVATPSGWKPEDIDFWRDYLKAVPEQNRLPGQSTKSFAIGSKSSAFDVDLPAGLFAALRRRRELSGATGYMIMLAAYVDAFAEWTGQRRFGIATPVSGRTTSLAWQQIGFFAYPILLNFNLTAAHTMNDVLAIVKQQVRDVLAHQELPFGEIVRASKPNGRIQQLPFLDIMFNYHQRRHDSAVRVDGMTWTLIPLDSGVAESLLNSMVVETKEQNITMNLRYASDHLSRHAVEDFACILQSRLAAIA